MTAKPPVSYLNQYLSQFLRSVQRLHVCASEQKVELQTIRARFKPTVARCVESIFINPNIHSFPVEQEEKKKAKEGREWMHFLLIYLSFTLFPPVWETGGNKWLPSPSPLSLVWADSTADGGLSSEFMSATVLMLQKEKKRTHIKRHWQMHLLILMHSSFIQYAA